MNEIKISIECLDHVALRVKDLKRSEDWYGKTLGLKKVLPAAWGNYPIFMVAENNTGVALFPSEKTTEKMIRKVDHFAFRIHLQEFQQTQEHLNGLGIEFQFQDHVYFHSIYFEDPDGHTVEITTQVKPLE